MALPLVNTFNGGTDGVTLTDANTAGASGDGFSVAGAEFVFTNVQSHSGGMAARIVDPTTFGFRLRWVDIGAAITTDVFTRIYLYMPTLPVDNNFYPINFRTTANANSCLLRILSTGMIQMRDSTNSGIGTDGTIAVASGQWVRIEVRVNTGAGGMEWRLYNDADSDTITQTRSVSGASLGADTDEISYGINTARPLTFTSYWDDFAATTAGWIGPVVAEEEEVVAGYQRLYGPAQLGTSAATLYTVPDGMRATLRNVYVNNPSGSEIEFTLSAGTDAAGTRLFDQHPVPANDSFVGRRATRYTLEAGETIQGFSDAATTVIMINGYLEAI